MWLIENHKVVYYDNKYAKFENIRYIPTIHYYLIQMKD